MQTLYTKSLGLAKQLLDFAQPGVAGIGASPAEAETARALALNILRPIAASLKVGHAEAAFLLASHAPTEAESDENLIRAAVWDYADARATVRNCGSAELQKRLELEIARVNADC